MVLALLAAAGAWPFADFEPPAFRAFSRVQLFLTRKSQFSEHGENCHANQKQKDNLCQHIKARTARILRVPLSRLGHLVQPVRQIFA